ncbi:IS66 family insertion sequence element accessory protein TnpB [Desemzia sp. FAM 23989]|uniref:IS66 family insertion sequence element accessory protein TnpB n=1 Tax=Desemzia sp. FAM 23989 TaxID=3259523 RepID=UPI00388630A6
MIIDYAAVKKIYIVCGYTDMRKGIDGLAMVIQNQFELDLYQDTVIFLFCGRRSDRYKALFWDNDGFSLLYKRIDSGKLQWPRTEREVKQLSQRELRWLLEGLKIDQPKAISTAQKGGAF